VAYGGGTYVAVGNKGIILTSPDGAKWTKRQSPVTYALWRVAFGRGGFVVVGDVVTILTSANGSDWTKRESGIKEMINLGGITYGSNGYVAVGEGGMILISADGLNWKTVSPVTANDLRSVTYCSGRYIATGILDTPEKSLKFHSRVYISQDGEKWSAMSIAESFPFYGVACGSNRTLVVVGSNIVQSDPLPEAD